MEYRFRRLAAGAAVLTGVLMLLGVYTAAAGAGLTCGRRWPLCDGAVFGLFPADWLSFVEWFHRLVALVTGFVVLGTAAAAWLDGRTRRVRWALAAAVVLLPAQIALGALTVTTYEWLVLVAHFVTALAILTGVALAALWTAAPHVDRRAGVRRATLLGVALALPLVALIPRLLVVFSAPVQVAYYAAGLALYGALLAAATWSSGAGEPGDGRLIRPTAAVGALLLSAVLVVGRQHGDAATLVGVWGTVGTLLAVGAVAWLARGPGDGRTPGVPGGD